MSAAVATLIEAARAHADAPGAPVGYLVTVGLASSCTLAALTARRAGGVLAPAQYLLGFVVNEQPILACYWLGAATLLAAVQGHLRPSAAWLVAGAAAILIGGLVTLAVRSLHARPVVDRALDDGLPAGWRHAAGVQSAADLTPQFEAARLLIWPVFVRRPDVQRIAGIRYADAGRANLLDLYRGRRVPTDQDLRPVLVHLHGGALVMGRKNREGLPLIYRLASRGWVCVSPNYRLGGVAHWPDHVIDVKKVIAWLREHGPEHGANPDQIFLAGASSGAQLAAVAALTGSDPRFQPGFEETDTSVCAAVALYGHYGWGDTGLDAAPSSPLAYVHADAPPFFIAHGDRDTLLPASAAREFATALRGRSRSPVVYAELPGAQHQFDLFHSVGCTAVVNGIEAFASWVLR